MTIQEFLTDQGLTPEEIAAVVGNEKQSKALSAALSKFDEGSAKLAAAQDEEKKTAKFWADKVQELDAIDGRMTATERRAVKAEAVAASRTAYLKTLKDQGYDVPDEMITGASAAASAEPPKSLTREEITAMLRGTAPDLVTLVGLQAEYQDLLGTPYVGIDQDFAEAQKEGKPLREFVRNKYSFDAKRAEKQQKAESERIEKLVAERMKPKEEELAAKYGTNPNLSTPMPSKFDKLEKQPGFKSDSWKSAEGRKANRDARVKRFENVSLQ